jgi:hypothetical protein
MKVWKASRTLRSIPRRFVMCCSFLHALSYYACRRRSNNYTISDLASTRGSRRSFPAKLLMTSSSTTSTRPQLIDEDLKSTMENFERLLPTGEITYDLLWMLFVPNLPVYHYHLLTEQDKILRGRSVKLMTTHADLSCRIVTYNGRAFGYGDETIQIPHFDGVCKIRELGVYPLECHADKKTIREAAVLRGKKYAALGETSHHQISGRSIRFVQAGVRDFWVSICAQTSGRCAERYVLGVRKGYAGPPELRAQCAMANGKSTQHGGQDSAGAHRADR